MNDLQENTLTMLESVENRIEANKPIWEKDKIFAGSYTRFLDYKSKLKILRDDQKLFTEGVTKDKEEKRTKLIEKAYYIATRLQSFAVKTKNTVLENAINYSKSSFKKQRDTDLEGVCNTIYNKAKEYLPDLKDYKVDQDELDKLKKLIDDFVEVLGKPRNVQSDSKDVTANLAQIFKDILKLLTDELDKDILVFQEEYPSFVSNYFNDRKIIKTARTKKAIIASVLEDDETTPVAGVKVTITAGAGASKSAAGAKSEVFKKKTTAKGGFHLINIPAGSYEIKLEKLGFVPQTIPVNVLVGETANLKVKLVKE